MSCEACGHSFEWHGGNYACKGCECPGYVRKGANPSNFYGPKAGHPEYGGGVK